MDSSTYYHGCSFLRSRTFSQFRLQFVLSNKALSERLFSGKIVPYKKYFPEFSVKIGEEMPACPNFSDNPLLEGLSLVSLRNR